MSENVKISSVDRLKANAFSIGSAFANVPGVINPLDNNRGSQSKVNVRW